MEPTWQTSDGSVQLYCGDCIEILPELASGSIGTIVTDPPYAILGGGASVAGKGVEEAFDVQFFRTWFKEVLCASTQCTKDSAALWMTIDWRGAIAVEQAASRSAWRLAGVGVWDRGGLGMGYALRKTYENFALLVREKWTRSQTDESDVWRHEWYPSLRTTGHQAEKPVELLQRAIRLCGGDGPVLDPFMGSASTGVACARIGRGFVGIEKEPHYFDIAVARIEAELSRAPLFEPKPQIQRSFLEESA